jgi:hypothetical protein
LAGIVAVLLDTAIEATVVLEPVPVLLEVP